jgi:SOS-response transcriptional repressor LexA
MNGWVERVKERMKLLELSREALAQELGVTYGAITHYLTGRRIPPLGQFHKLAEVLKTDPAWLHYGKHVMKASDTKIVTNEAGESLKHPVPIVNYVEATRFIDDATILRYEAQEFVPQFYSEHSHWYALRVQGDAMAAPLGNMKTFIEGNIIVIDRQKKVSHGSYVIALLEGAEEVTFKQYVVDSGIAYLKPLNTQYPMVKLDDRARLCGVVVWCLNQFI